MKTVVVTGGTVRLGRAIAEGLRAAGWRVLTSSHRPDAGADIVADLADPAGPDELLDAACRLLGGELPEALVNNAAVFEGEPSRVTQLNYLSPRRMTTRLAARAGGRGSVVNVLDTRVLREIVPDGGAYGVTKQALLAATRADAIRYAESLNVNGVAPGPVLAPTDVHEKAGQLPLGVRPTPEDVARAVVFLLSAPATSGVVIPVDGGQCLL